MIRTLTSFSTRAIALAALVSAAATAVAQPNDILWGNTSPTGGDWLVGANWPQFGAPPEATGFNEQAVIDNGGLAFLNGTAANVGAVTLGTADNTTGALEIRDGGSLTVVNNGTTSGIVEVGVQGGTPGFLTVERGGSLTTRQLRSAAGDSTVQFGVGAGSGVATVNVTAATFFRTDTRFTPNTSFTTEQLVLGGQSNIIAEITSTTQPSISVGSFANLGGTLTFEFDGVTPDASSSWTVLDAGGIVNGFGAIESPTELGPGLRFAQEVVDAGSRQELLVTVEEDLTLMVNRSTGAATLMSESGTPVAISAYNVRSGDGTINTGYTTLQSQGLGGFVVSGPDGVSATQSGELSPTGGISVDATGISLGTLYAAPPVPDFGTPIVDDLRFDYVRADGRFFIAETEFDTEAITNNLVLTIDPTTGNARLTNDSETDLNLDVYSIASESESLLTTWDSLADQGSTGWQEANPSTGRVSELNPTGALSLVAGGSFDLTGLWDISGVADVDDITLEFRDTVLGEFDGVVLFEALTAGVPGDYNGDNVVNAADYTVWRDAGPTDVLLNDVTPGTVDGSDYTVWRANFGNSLAATSSAAAVPEPSTLLGVLAGLLTAALGRRRRLPMVATSRLTSHRSFSMPKRLTASLALIALVGATASAQPVTITGADTMNLPGAFDDGSITITPIDRGGVPIGFGPSDRFLGPSGGNNANAIQDVDGDPLTIDDRESILIDFASGVGLVDFRFAFTRANPITISGFASDPDAYLVSNPNNGADIAFDVATNTLAIYNNSFVDDDTIIGFNSLAASAGQSLVAEVTDFNQGNPQLAISGITYDTSIVPIIAGDVDGLNGVTIDDFNIIQANFWTEGTRAEGDLTGDGFVSLVDFTQWEANFAGNSTGLIGTLPVPEPGTIVIALLAVVGVAHGQRR